ncbi:MAG TPA: hypothetical protein VGI86_05555 [Acidimicrobiia bacterium]
MTAGFFSFTEVTDPAAHHSYNEWHQLDHMPEQFPLDGIVFGQRWVWPPARRTSAQGGPGVRNAGDAVAVAPFDRVHYVTLYLMREPLDTTLTEFLDLGKQLGRVGRFHRDRHAHLSGPFELIDTRAAARVQISAEAVPYRPHGGVHVIVESLVGDDHACAGYDTWWRDEHAPALCGLDGVAGVWQFETSSRFDAHIWRPGPRRVTVAWIDGDLDHTSSALALLDGTRESRSQGIASADMIATLETITPWQWDWFDRA